MNIRGIILVLFIILIAFITNVNAQNLDNIKDTYNQLQDSDGRADFFHEKWTSWLQDTGIGSFMIQTETIGSKFNVVFEKVPGITFAWSFKFLFAIFLFLVILGYSYRLTYLFNDKIYQNLLVGLIATILISWLGLIRYLVVFITSKISAIESFEGKFLASFLVVILIMFIGIISLNLKLGAKQARKEEKFKKIEKKVKEIEESEKDEEKEEVDEENQEQRVGKDYLQTLGRRVLDKEE